MCTCSLATADPARLLSDTIVHVESFSARLANLVLPESGGGDVRLGSLWERNPAVIVFLRHWG